MFPYPRSTTLHPFPICVHPSVCCWPSIQRKELHITYICFIWTYFDDFGLSGGEVDQVVLWPLGGYTLCSPKDGIVSDGLWITVMGPVMHIPQALIWVGIYAALQKGDFSNFTRTINLDDLRDGGIDGFAAVLAEQSSFMNVALFIFNLAIPAYPLDGGRCFSVLMVMAGFSVKVSGMLTSILAILIGLVLVYYGTYLYVVEKSGSGIFIGLVAMFICYSSLELLKVVSSGRVTDHVLFDRDCYRVERQRTKVKPVPMNPAATSEIV